MAGILAACDEVRSPEGPQAYRARKWEPPKEDPVDKTVRERQERNAYAVPPRNYPSQTNTSPVGWQPPPANQPAANSMPGAPQQTVAAAPMAPPSAMPPRPTDKPPQAPASQPAMAQPAAAMAEPNPPLPAGYVPSVPAPASAPAMASMPAMSGVAAGSWHAHIASHRSEEAAINDWQRRLKENPAVYGELEPALLWADVPNRGSYARLVFGNFASKADAQAACGKISGPGRYCNVIQEKP